MFQATAVSPGPSMSKIPSTALPAIKLLYGVLTPARLRKATLPDKKIYVYMFISETVWHSYQY